MRAHLNTHRACAADGSTVGPLTIHFSSHSLQLVSVYMWVLFWKPAFPSARGKRDWKCFPCLDTHIPPPPHSPDILLLECQAFQGCLISFAEGSTFPCLAFNMPPAGTQAPLAHITDHNVSYEAPLKSRECNCVTVHSQPTGQISKEASEKRPLWNLT